MDNDAAAWHHALTSLITAGHSLPASDLATALAEVLRPLGIGAAVFLVDREQRTLRMLAARNQPDREPIPIEGSLGGRAYMLVTPLYAASEPTRVWMPIVDGTERLGVVELTLPEGMDFEDPRVRADIDAMAGLLGHLVVAKTQYGDTISRARSSQAASAGAETLWRLLPPLTFTTHDLVIAAILEPCYTIGGDAYDYAVDGRRARIAIFDSLGHGLGAALTTTVALGASRSVRIQGADLTDMAAAVDAAITDEFDDSRFATAVLADLDLVTGVLRYINAGHPPPVLIRGGKAVTRLDAGRRMPLGLTDPHVQVAELALEPEDRLLFYTDGFTEAHDERDEQFGLERLIDVAERHAIAGLAPPEMLRRLGHDLLDYQHGPLRDDATLLMLTWNSPVSAEMTLP
ncbi:MAG TPA: PP2C family protein-serine/threonine phosphatase [Micromonosporaceae bacterium]